MQIIAQVGTVKKLLIVAALMLSVGLIMSSLSEAAAGHQRVDSLLSVFWSTYNSEFHCYESVHDLLPATFYHASVKEDLSRWEVLSAADGQLYSTCLSKGSERSREHRWHGEQCLNRGKQVV